MVQDVARKRKIQISSGTVSPVSGVGELDVGTESSSIVFRSVVDWTAVLVVFFSEMAAWLALAVCEGGCEAVGDVAGKIVGVTVGVTVGVASGDGVGVTTGDGVGVTAGDGVGVTPGDGVGVTTGEGVGVTTGDGVGVTTGDGVGVTTGDGVGVTTGDGVGVTAGDGVGVEPPGVGVGVLHGMWCEIMCHSPELPSSRLQRSHPSPVTEIKAFADGAMIVAAIPSEATVRFLASGIFQMM